MASLDKLKYGKKVVMRGKKLRTDQKCKSKKFKTYCRIHLNEYQKIFWILMRCLNKGRIN